MSPSIRLRRSLLSAHPLYKIVRLLSSKGLTATVTIIIPTTAGTAASIIPSVSVGDAMLAAESQLNATFDEATFPTPTLVYLARRDQSLALAHVFQVRNAQLGTWYEAFVDAHSGKLLSITNFVADATVRVQSELQQHWLAYLNLHQYRVLPITKQVLTEGFEDIVDPQDPHSSPLGWHNDGKILSNTTEYASPVCNK